MYCMCFRTNHPLSSSPYVIQSSLKLWNIRFVGNLSLKHPSGNNSVYWLNYPKYCRKNCLKFQLMPHVFSLWGQSLSVLETSLPFILDIWYYLMLRVWCHSILKQPHRSLNILVCLKKESCLKVSNTLPAGYLQSCLLKVWWNLTPSQNFNKNELSTKNKTQLSLLWRRFAILMYFFCCCTRLGVIIMNT